MTNLMKITMGIFAMSMIMLILALVLFLQGVRGNKLNFHGVIEEKERIIKDALIDGEGESYNTLTERLYKWEEKVLNISEKHADIFINVIKEPYYAKGDGITDDTFAIQTAIDEAGKIGGGTVFIPNGGERYIISSPLILHPNVIIQSDGAVIDISGIKSNDTGRGAIVAKGSLDDPVNIIGQVEKGSYSMEIENAEKFSEGDYVLMGSSRDYYDLTDGSGFSESGQRGEIKRIRRIDSKTGMVTFEEPIYDGYDSKDDAFAMKVNFMENIAIKGIGIANYGETAKEHVGVELEYVNGFEITGNVIGNMGGCCINISSSIRGDVSGNRMETSLSRNEVKHPGVGIALLNSSQWIKVHDNYSETAGSTVKICRLTIGDDRWGKPRFITINGNMAKGITGADINGSYAFDYRLGEGISFDGNIISGYDGGFRLYSGDAIIVNNVIKDTGSAAIHMAYGMMDIRNVMISNNTINDIRANTGKSKYAMKFTFSGESVVENVSINNNIIECSSRNGIIVETEGNRNNCEVKNFIIQNNVMKGPMGDDTHADYEEEQLYALHVACHGITVMGNKAFNIQQFLQVRADDVTIKDNIVINVPEDTDVSLSEKWCVSVEEGSKNTVINGNILKHTHRGIIINNADNTFIYNNYIGSNTGQYMDDRGSNTIYINNKEV